jgi:Flp pilus assembly protein TadD
MSAADGQRSGDVRPPQAWLAEASAHEEAGRLDEAESLLNQLIAAAPAFHPAMLQAGVLAYRRGRSSEALNLFQRAVELAPDNAVYHRNLGELYRAMARLDEAVIHGLRAVELSPNDAFSHHNLGIIHYDRLESAEAMAAERRALELDPSMPSAHFELSESLLLTGQFAAGWEEYEWRFQLPAAAPLLPSSDRPQWDGRPMADGTLMLIGDQGFGDTIQFARYIRLAAERCPDLIVACSAEMFPIVSQQPGIRRYFDRWEQMPDFAAYCPLSGLPRLFKTDLDTIPGPIPYVRAEPALVEHWRRRLDALAPHGHRRIGLVWAGRPTHGNDFNRSMTLKDMAPLGDVGGMTLFSLQIGEPLGQIGGYYGRAPLINLGAEIRNFSDTMAILANLDRLVTVDTGVAHLAGAMGRPVSILLPFAPDWRWLLNRADSPWYPSVTLFRQSAPGQWSEPVAAVAAALIR